MMAGEGMNQSPRSSAILNIKNGYLRVSLHVLYYFKLEFWRKATGGNRANLF